MPEKKPTTTTIRALVGIDTMRWGELRAIVAATAHQNDDQIDWHFDSDGNLDGIYVNLEI